MSARERAGYEAWKASLPAPEPRRSRLRMSWIIAAAIGALIGVAALAGVSQG
jgi:hypothetical protein